MIKTMRFSLGKDDKKRGEALSKNVLDGKWGLLSSYCSPLLSF